MRHNILNTIEKKTPEKITVEIKPGVKIEITKALIFNTFLVESSRVLKDSWLKNLPIYYCTRKKRRIKFCKDDFDYYEIKYQLEP